MAFAVFRRHQKKLLAVFAIMAMFGFVLSDSLPNLMGWRGNAAGEGKTVVAVLYGKPVRVIDLEPLKIQRINANRLVGGFRDPSTGNSGLSFGDVRQRALIDAYILQHEADRLGIPLDKQYAETFLKGLFRGKLTKALFNAHLKSAFQNTMVSGERVLLDVAGELRLQRVHYLPGAPPVTPFDVWERYHETEEQVSVKAVAFKAEDYLKEVAEPSESAVKELFEKGKDLLPDPERETPGFKVPREIEFAYLEIDGAALASEIRKSLSAKEVTDYLETHESELEPELLKPALGDLPFDVFQDDPKAKLTPRPERETRPIIETKIAEERARERIEEKFDALRRDVFDPFANRRGEIQNKIDEAKETGKLVKLDLPKPPDAGPIAEKQGLSLRQTPLLSRDAAAKRDPLAQAERGLTWPASGRKLVEEFYDSTIDIGDPVEFTDPKSVRYLVWKVEDVAEHSPDFESVKSAVVAAWKTAEAAKLAKKAAEALAAEVEKNKGAFPESFKDKPIITTAPAPRMHRAFYYGNRMIFPAMASKIDEIPLAGEAFRKAMFSLEPGEVKTEPNAPHTAYYVMTLNKRTEPGFNELFSGVGPHFQIKAEVGTEALQARVNAWMETLREQAGLKPDWIPPDERDKKDQPRRPEEPSGSMPLDPGESADL